MELGETCCPKHFCRLGIVKGGGMPIGHHWCQLQHMECHWWFL